MAGVIIFTSLKLNIRKGGPSGYVANLKLALNSVEKKTE